MVLTDAERSRISNAIRDAEARTSGEIACVLSSDTPADFGLPVLLAALVGLVTPWLLVAGSAWPVTHILLVQIAVFAVLVWVFCLAPVRRAIVPKAARRARVDAYARAQFHAHGLHRTRNATGILIFVSLPDRYARIVADEGIAARVPQSAWQDTVDRLTTRMAQQEIAAGFLGAIAECAAILEQHFPRSADDTNELPNRIIEI